MVYYARKNEDCTKWQPLEDHLTNVADRCNDYTSKFIKSDVGYVLGKSHDLGKYTPEFVRKLAGENIKAEHSIFGASSLHEEYKLTGNILYRLGSHVVAGHHSTLRDFGIDNDTASLSYRLANRPTSEINYQLDLSSYDVSNIALYKYTSDRNLWGFNLMLLTRFMYSALVDADRLDAQMFSEEIEPKEINLSELENKLESFMQSINSDTPIGRIRSEIYNDCSKSAISEKGLFRLTVPTGGGKTLSSAKFALAHANYNKMDRVIFISPFKGITGQTASVYGNIFGNEVITEHHSDFDTSLKVECSESKLARENWNNAIIVTTMVQFFESLFSAKASRCRKLHNITNSVIVIDEIQSLPSDYVIPCIRVLESLVKYYDCSIVLCSATQPMYEEKLGLNAREIISDTQMLYAKLKRVHAEFLGIKDNGAIAKIISDNNQVLSIVNTKAHANDLYDLVSHLKNTYYLTTNMCNTHIKDTLDKIKLHLKNNDPCRVIATQLIEAGIDIDFPIVIRSLTGIDSINQAGGRCNREGKLDLGMMYVYRPDDDKYIGKGHLSRTASIGEETIVKYDDILSQDAIAYYYKRLYQVCYRYMDSQDIMALSKKGERQLAFDYLTVSSRFNLINDNGYSVIVPYNVEAINFIKNLANNANLRIANKYSVNVSKNNLVNLLDTNLAKEVAEGVYVLDKTAYDNKKGVLI